jgi:hypothetical protein
MEEETRRSMGLVNVNYRYMGGSNASNTGASNQQHRYLLPPLVRGHSCTEVSKMKNQGERESQRAREPESQRARERERERERDRESPSTHVFTGIEASHAHAGVR